MKTPAAKAPQIQTEMIHPQFCKFKMDWNVFKKITNISTSQIYAQSIPNTGCFSHQWLLLDMGKLVLKKSKNNLFFQDKFFSLKTHAHYFLFSYT